MVLRDARHGCCAAAMATPPPINIPKQLRRAAGSKDPASLPAFLEGEPLLALSDLDDTSYDGRSALHMAAWTGHPSNVSLLLDMGCDIDGIATGTHTYGKSAVFFAATRSREDVVNLLLDRGANVLIVNNKGQSLYSIACSHFEEGLVRRIARIEIEQQGVRGNGADLGGWVDYKKTHSDGCVYGDSDLRFLGRELAEGDVVKDGVVNPTTRESRRGNFARNNPHVSARASGKESEGRNRKQKKKRQVPAPVALTEEENVQLEKAWEEVGSALRAKDEWRVFSSLLSIVQFMERKKVKSRWVVESASRLSFLVRSETLLCGDVIEDGDVSAPGSSSPMPAHYLRLVLSEAVIFCGSGDRCATLVKRIMTKASEGNLGLNGMLALTKQEEIQLDHFWNDAELALKCNKPKDVFVSLMKIVILWDAKSCQWLPESIMKLHEILATTSFSLDDAAVREVLSFSENSDGRHTLLLRKLMTKSTNHTRERSKCVDESSRDKRNTTKKNANALPNHYNSIMKLLRMVPEGKGSIPSWTVLTKRQSAVHREAKYFTLPQPPKWVDSAQDLQLLQSKMRDVIGKKSNKSQHGIELDSFIAFDSEFMSANGSTELATIQFSLLEDGIPFAWVVDLHPNPSDDHYSFMTSEILRWLFIESDANLLGFAHKQDICKISSYIGEDIPVPRDNFLDVQLLAMHEMAKELGLSNDTPSLLPSLKKSCSFFFSPFSKMEGKEDSGGVGNSMAWELSKEEQCSNWGKRPLTSNQLEYAGLDAAVLIILLAEIIRR